MMKLTDTDKHKLAKEGYIGYKNGMLMNCSKGNQRFSVPGHQYGLIFVHRITRNKLDHNGARMILNESS